MDMKYKFRITAVFIVTVMLITAALPVLGAARITTCVNLLEINKNVSGQGYRWDNINSELTIHGLNVETNDAFGFKVPSGATVIIEGTNIIKAAETALYCEGSITFRGSGKLTLEGGKYGYLNNSARNTERSAFLEAEYNIKGGEASVFSENARVQISGCKMKLSSDGAYSAKSYELIISSLASLRSDKGLFADNMLEISDSEVEIAANNSALVCDRGVTLRDVEIFSDGEKIDSYSGQGSIKTSPTAEHIKRSMIFGDKYPITYDIFVLLGVVVLLSAVIVLPILRHKRKLKRYQENCK